MLPPSLEKMNYGSAWPFINSATQDLLPRPSTPAQGRPALLSRIWVGHARLCPHACTGMNTHGHFAQSFGSCCSTGQQKYRRPSALHQTCNANLLEPIPRSALSAHTADPTPDGRGDKSYSSTPRAAPGPAPRLHDDCVICNRG